MRCERVASIGPPTSHASASTASHASARRPGREVIPDDHDDETSERQQPWPDSNPHPHAATPHLQGPSGHGGPPRARRQAGQRVINRLRGSPRCVPARATLGGPGSGCFRRRWSDPRLRAVGGCSSAASASPVVASTDTASSSRLRWLISTIVGCPPRSFQRDWMRTSSFSPTSRMTTTYAAPPCSIDSTVASVAGRGSSASTSPSFCLSSLAEVLAHA